MSYLVYLSGLVYLTFCFIFTTGVFVKVILFKKSPMDTSNIFNPLRLIWWAITRPYMFKGFNFTLKWRLGLLKDVILNPESFSKEFPWLTKDELEDIRGEG